MTTQKTSDFYWACRNGDLDTVRRILPRLRATDINRIESNGSTALHAASFYGHSNVVQLLLEREADATIKNKFGNTAEQEASTNEIRALFEKKLKVQEDGEDDDDQPPQSEFVQVYPNEQNKEKSELATRILKARLGTYQAHQYTLSASSNIDHLEAEYRRRCADMPGEFRKGEHCFQEYRKTGDFKHMLRLYTMETPFYSMIHGDETFLVEAYKHLMRFEKYTYKGKVYRGVVVHSKDLKPYEWACAHPKSLLEIRKLMSTSMDRDMVLKFALDRLEKIGNLKGVLLEMNFKESCFSTIVTKDFSAFEVEEEVLVMSGTFFEVTGIKDGENGLTIITLENVLVKKAIF